MQDPAVCEEHNGNAADYLDEEWRLRCRPLEEKPNRECRSEEERPRRHTALLGINLLRSESFAKPLEMATLPDVQHPCYSSRLYCCSDAVWAISAFCCCWYIWVSSRFNSISSRSSCTLGVAAVA